MHTSRKITKYSSPSAAFSLALGMLGALTSLLAACGTADVPSALAIAGTDERTSPNRGAWAGKESTLALTSAADAYCAPGFAYNATYRLCESSVDAQGPFPPAMVEACKKAGGGFSCGREMWNKRFAESLRGTAQCAPGTTLDASRGECSDGTDVYGPFSRKLVETCRAKGGSQICETMRWPASYVDVQKAGASANARVYAYYSQQANYNRVFNNVMGWFGTTVNGCAAFMSTALRQSGFDIPQNATIDGYRVSTWTASFSKYLVRKGWSRIDNHEDLRPGDVVFTVGNPGDDAHPLHTYMFHSWKDRTNKIGWVVDNQAFTHERDIFNYGSHNFSPFKYALRSRD